MSRNNPYRDLRDLLPGDAWQTDIDRLQGLVEEAALPRLAVVGKYNHGKSSLLNALIGRQVFKTSDKRETTRVSRHEADGIAWVDTPGLDADVDGLDDQLARQVAFSGADALLVVHSAVDGELDQDEMEFLGALGAAGMADRAMLVVSCIDGVDAESLAQTLEVIAGQVAAWGITPIAVSSARYAKGVAEKKPRLREAAGFAPLQARLAEWRDRHESDRRATIDALRHSLSSELERRLALDQIRLDMVSGEYGTRQNTFKLDILELLIETRQKVAAL